MNYRFHPDAEGELDAACAYYESRRAGLGRRFAEAFDEALAKVLQHPLAWGVLDEPFRVCRLKRFPYGLLYEPRAAEIVIVAVMDLHRRPGYWKDRVESNEE